jgi:hypothetical protein
MCSVSWIIFLKTIALFPFALYITVNRDKPKMYSILSVLDQRLTRVLGTGFTDIYDAFRKEWMNTATGYTCTEHAGSTGAVVTTLHSDRYELTFHVDVANIKSKSFLRLVSEKHSSAWVLVQTSILGLDMTKAVAKMQRIMSFDIVKTCYYSLCVESGSLMFDTDSKMTQVGLRIYDNKPPQLYVGKSLQPYMLCSQAPDQHVFTFLALGSPCTLNGTIGEEVELTGCPDLTSGQPITMKFVQLKKN